MGVRLRKDAKTVNAAQLNDAGNRESTANRNWDQINWDLAEKTVNRMQVRIVKASVRRLAKLLLRSCKGGVTNA